MPFNPLTVITSFFFRAHIVDYCWGIAPNNSRLACCCVVRLLFEYCLILQVASVGRDVNWRASNIRLGLITYWTAKTICLVLPRLISWYADAVGLIFDCGLIILPLVVLELVFLRHGSFHIGLSYFYRWFVCTILHFLLRVLRPFRILLIALRLVSFTKILKLHFMLSLDSLYLLTMFLFSLL